MICPLYPRKPAVGVYKYSMEKHWASAHGTAIITDAMRRQVEVNPKEKEWPQKKWETATKKRRQGNFL